METLLISMLQQCILVWPDYNGDTSYDFHFYGLQIVHHLTKYLTIERLMNTWLDVHVCACVFISV